ncbi:ankyrin repeat domain-containing protein [Legionella sp. MW5194]|uniref:ankyrin repeat domain-containing protein n=1 Tax=Legionella sp. MW5194 TaxID=2662448 RepID=UPI00193D3D89|nr:ankyrin repeat domain-containing protein [Legionella sp. MW5194]
MTEAPRYRQLLLSLEIDEYLIPKSLSEEQCQFLYGILKQFSPGFIKKTWQLGALLWNKFFHPRFDSLDQFENHLGHYAALAGNRTALESMKAAYPEKLKQTNHAGNTLAHYAAMAGRLEVLEWIKNHCPALLTQTSHDGFTLAHFAAKAGQIPVLKWIKAHYPHVLTRKSKTGSTFAHCAALSGDVPTLEWIKRYTPQFLIVRNHQGDTLAHWIAESDNPAALVWIKQNCPELIHALNHKGQSIVHFASLSGNTKQLNLALTLMDNPTLIDLTTSSAKQLKRHGFYAMIEAVLQTNHTLIELRLPPAITLTQALQDRLAENKKIKDILITYTFFCHAKNHAISRLPKDILFRLFSDAISDVTQRLSPRLTAGLFDKIYNGSKPNRLKGAMMIEKQLVTLRKQLQQPSCQTRALAIAAEIDALVALKQLVLCSNHLTDVRFKTWCQAHAEILRRPQQGFFSFFAPKTLVQSLCALFGFNESMITALRDKEKKETVPESEGTVTYRL